jgi:N-acyl homoserine lactone hydrolase
MSKNIKLQFLPLGSISCDTNALVAFSVRATSVDSHPTCCFKPFPVWAAYIETPEAKIMLDTGLREDCLTGGEPEITKINVPISFQDGETLEHQMELCGVKPEEIDYLVMSHLHHDHAGRVGIFSNAKVIVQQREMERALIETHVMCEKGVYIKQDLEVKANWELIDGDMELVPGVKVLLAPGHSEGLQCLQLELDNTGTVLLTSDACFTKLNWGPPMRPAGVLYDSKAYFASLQKLHLIAKETDATVIFGHDADQFASLRKAPEYYD